MNYNWRLIKTRTYYLWLLLPYLTASKVVNLSKVFVNYFFRKNLFTSVVPPVWVLILTYKCNYKCIMCQKSSQDENPYKNPKSMDFRIIETAIRKHHKKIGLIQLIGGEPLYYGHFNDVIDLLHELKIGYFITTNGSLLSRDISAKIINKCLWISLSIDAVTPNLYKQVRRGGDIEIITKNLNILNNLKSKYNTNKPYINANATIFNYNIGELPKLINFCVKNSIGSLSISAGRLYNTPDVDERQLVRSNYKESIIIIENAKRIAKENNFLLRVAFRSLFGIYNRKKIGSRRITHKALGSFLEITIQPDFTIVDACREYAYVNSGLERLSENWIIYLSTK